MSAAPHADAKPPRWLFTPVAIAELALAVVAFVAALILAFGTYRQYIRAGRLADVARAHAKGPKAAELTLYTVHDRFGPADQGFFSSFVKPAYDPLELGEIEGATHLGRGQLPEAERSYRALLEAAVADGEDEAAAEARLGLGVTALESARAEGTTPEARAARIDEARRQLRDAETDLGSRPDPEIYLAALEVEARAAAPALRDAFDRAERVVAKSPSRAVAGALVTLYHARGIAHLRAGEAGAAVAALKRAAELVPGDARVEAALGLALATQAGADVATHADARRAIERVYPVAKGGKRLPMWGLEPHTGIVREAMGIAQFRAGDAATARELLEQARRELPESASVVRSLAVATRALLDVEKAAGPRKELMRKGAEAFAEAGKRYAPDLDRPKAGDPTGGVPADPARRDAAFRCFESAGVLFVELGDTTAGLRELDRAAKLAPGGAEDLALVRNRAIALDRGGRSKEAIEAYWRILEAARAAAASGAPPPAGVASASEAFAVEQRVKKLEGTGR